MKISQLLNTLSNGIEGKNQHNPDYEWIASMRQWSVSSESPLR